MAGPANRLRIIGGTHRGRVVRFADTPGLRPTPDRVRETLFNWLGQQLTGLTTFDAYAGSGVLSLEALSRGAAAAIAVDRDAARMRAVRDQAATFALAGLETICGDALGVLARESRRFDVIFLDPPFTDDPWPRLFPLCAARLAAGGFIYAEAGRELQPPQGLAVHRHSRAGQVHYHLLRNATP